VAYMGSAWSRCTRRFDEVEAYIETSWSVAPRSNLQYRADLYGTWVLMTYAACQYSLEEIGRACLDFLGSRAGGPRKLTDDVRRAHLRLTINAVRRALDDGSRLTDADLMLQNIQSSRWAEHSALMAIERNVWPDYVREWLLRLGVEGNSLAWMQQAAPGKTETYYSRMNALVAERNPIAHGVAAGQTLNAQLMQDWLCDCRGFVEKCAMAVGEHLVRTYRPRLRKVGLLNTDLALGARTAALHACLEDLAVGDHLVLKSSQSVRIARVESMMSHDTHLRSAPRGTAEVAVVLSKKHGNCNLYLVP